MYIYKNTGANGCKSIEMPIYWCMYIYTFVLIHKVEVLQELI